MLTLERVKSILASSGFEVSDASDDALNNVLRFLALHEDLITPDFRYKNLNEIQKVLKSNNIRMENDDVAILMLAVCTIFVKETQNQTSIKISEYEKKCKEKYKIKQLNNYVGVEIDPKLLIFISVLTLLNILTISIGEFRYVISFTFGLLLASSFAMIIIKNYYYDKSNETTAKNLQSVKNDWTEAQIRQIFIKNNSYIVDGEYYKATVDILVNKINMYESAHIRRLNIGLLAGYVSDLETANKAQMSKSLNER